VAVVQRLQGSMPQASEGPRQSLSLLGGAPAAAAAVGCLCGAGSQVAAGGPTTYSTQLSSGSSGTGAGRRRDHIGLAARNDSGRSSRHDVRYLAIKKPILQSGVLYF
jgi:hypothetical protein